MNFTVHAALFHTLLLGYFWLADWYTQHWKSGLPTWMQTSVAIVYLTLLALSFLRVDLLAFNRRIRVQLSTPDLHDLWFSTPESSRISA